MKGEQGHGQGWGAPKSVVAPPQTGAVAHVQTNMSHLGGTETIPSRWLNNCTTLLYKSGDPTHARNYRSISIAPAMCVVLMKLILETVVPELSSSLVPEQYGTKGKTATRLAILLQDELNLKERAFAVFIDVAKAFPRVPHPVLLAKVNHGGMDKRTPQGDGGVRCSRHEGH